MAAQSQAPPYVACLQCTQHCVKTHGHGFSPCSRSPSFFSLLPPCPASAPLFLPIPPAFLGGRNIRIDQSLALGQHMYSEVQLEGPSGEVWPVAMQGPTLSSLAFTTGWEKFVKDHSLVAGDLLFFKLLSKGSFSVSIYGSDGCEKAEALTAQNIGARLVSNAKKRLVDNALQSASMGAEPKRRKLDANDKQITPPIIDIDDDDDENQGKECSPKPQSGTAKQIASSNDDLQIVGGTAETPNEGKECLPGNATQVASSNSDAPIVGGDVAESSDTCMCEAEQLPGRMMDAKEEKCSQTIPVDVPLTPNNADKGILMARNQTQTSLNDKEKGAGDQEGPLHHSGANCSEQEATSSEDEDFEQYDHLHEETSSESDSEGLPYCTDEATQRNRVKDLLAKDYMTEAFISKRRPVSGEERQRALQAAKGFKSSLPHLRKLMKESHVYRGFWLALPSDFASKYLPDEIQEMTLRDSSGTAWSARWLGRRCGISGGWRKFSLDHGLEEGDVCVFELIDRKKLVIKVHIFRVVELKNGLPGRDHYIHKPPSKSLLEYNSKKPSPSVKKMRGAIACGKTGYLHSSTSSSSRFEQRKQKQAEVEKLKGKGDTNSSYKKAEFISHQQTTKNLVSAGVSKALKTTNGIDKSGCSTNTEKSLKANGSEREGKALIGSNTTEVSLSLQTPPKTRESALDSIRVRLFGMTAARQVDPLPKGSGSGLLKSANEHVDGSKLNSSKKYYTVDRLFNRRKGSVEDEFLVELDIDEPLNCLSSKVKRDGNAWWVPLSHFTKDKTSCHL